MINNLIESMKLDNWIDSDFTVELLQFVESKESDRQKAVEKARSRTTDQREVDKARKSSDRDSDKRAEAANPWKGVVIVRTNEDGKTRLIPKNDFEPGRHELLYGQVSGEPAKPEVTPNVAQEISTQDDFEASKTSNRLLGVISKKKTPEEEIIKSDRYDYPKDGVEKTDTGSIYPDWDHAIESIPQGIQLVANSTAGRAVDVEAIRGYFGESQTLMDSSIRAYQQLGDQVKGNFVVDIPEEAYPPQGDWMEFVGELDTPTTDLIIQSQDGNVIKAALIQDNKKIIVDDEADVLFNFSLNTIGGNIEMNNKKAQKRLSKLEEKVSDELNKLKINVNNKYIFSKIEDLRLEILSELEDVLTGDVSFEKAVVLEGLSGKQKFGEESPASANALISMAKDGTNLKLTPLDEQHIRRLLVETTIKIKLDSNPQGSPFDMIMSLDSKSGEEPQINEFFEIYEASSDSRALFQKIMGNFESKLLGFLELMGVTVSAISINNVNLEAVGSMPSGDFTKVKVKGKSYYIPTEKDTNFYDGNALRLGEDLDYLEEKRKRNYKREYNGYHKRRIQKMRRAARNRDRRKYIKKYGKKKLKGYDVDHKNHNPLDSNGDTRLRKVSSNRGDNKVPIKEEHGAGDEGTTLLLLRYLKDTPHMTIPKELLKLDKKALRNDTKRKKG